MNILRLTKTYKAARRLQKVVNVFLRHGFGSVIDQINLGRFIPFTKRLRAFGHWPEIIKGRTVAERLRLAFAELGPSFIKLAQILATRPDLITALYASEFKKLQDEVPPFSTVEAKKIIEDEIKLPLNRVFREFEDVPVAAASIAQVHRAVLLDGTEVVVKVQRPGIRDVLDTDIEILFTLAPLLEKTFPEMKFFNPTGVVQEFQRTVKRELDFIEEGRNCCRFGRNFKDEHNIYFPKVYAEFLTEKVIVMERIDGVKIDDVRGIEAMGFDTKDVAKDGVRAYFKMVFEDGFFHADPHPGNIMVMNSGQICFLDFGIVGRVSEELKSTLAATFIALIKKDFDKLIDQYVEMGLVAENVDSEDFRRDFKADLVDFMEPLYGASLKEINFPEYLGIIIQLAVRHKMKLPPELLLINKAALILQDVGTRLDPDFDFISISEPFVSKLLKERMDPRRIVKKAYKDMSEAGEFLLYLPKQLRAAISKVMKNDFHMKITHIGLEHFIRDMDRASNRIAFALIVSSVLLSSAIMHAFSVGPTIYGMSVLGFLVFGFAAVLGVWLLISIIRSGRL